MIFLDASSTMARLGSGEHPVNPLANLANGTEAGWTKIGAGVLLWMGEILHHLGWLKPYE